MKRPRTGLEYLVTYPDGAQQTINNLAAFCRENNLTHSTMLRVAVGTVKAHRGFRARKVLYAVSGTRTEREGVQTDGRGIQTAAPTIA